METLANTAYALGSDWALEESSCKGVRVEGLAAYQLDGEVTAHHGDDA